MVFCRQDRPSAGSSLSSRSSFDDEVESRGNSWNLVEDSWNLVL